MNNLEIMSSLIKTGRMAFSSLMMEELILSHGDPGRLALATALNLRKLEKNGLEVIEDVTFLQMHQGNECGSCQDGCKRSGDKQQPQNEFGPGNACCYECFDGEVGPDQCVLHSNDCKKRNDQQQLDPINHQAKNVQPQSQGQPQLLSFQNNVQDPNWKPQQNYGQQPVNGYGQGNGCSCGRSINRSVNAEGAPWDGKVAPCSTRDKCCWRCGQKPEKGLPPGKKDYAHNWFCDKANNILWKNREEKKDQVYPANNQQFVQANAQQNPVALGQNQPPKCATHGCNQSTKLKPWTNKEFPYYEHCWDHAQVAPTSNPSQENQRNTSDFWPKCFVCFCLLGVLAMTSVYCLPCLNKVREENGTSQGRRRKDDAQNRRRRRDDPQNNV